MSSIFSMYLFILSLSSTLSILVSIFVFTPFRLAENHNHNDNYHLVVLLEYAMYKCVHFYVVSLSGSSIHPSLVFVSNNI